MEICAGRGDVCIDLLTGYNVTCCDGLDCVPTPAFKAFCEEK